MEKCKVSFVKNWHSQKEPLNVNTIKSCHFAFKRIEREGERERIDSERKWVSEKQKGRMSYTFVNILYQVENRHPLCYLTIFVLQRNYQQKINCPMLSRIIYFTLNVFHSTYTQNLSSFFHTETYTWNLTI